MKFRNQRRIPIASILKIALLSILIDVRPTHAAPFGPQNLRVRDKGAHHRQWEYKTFTQVEDEVRERSHSYIELNSGMHVWSEAEQQWQDASDEIELFEGAAIARGTGHRVIFSAVMNEPDGPLDLQMADGKRLRTRLLGIAFTETDTGRTALIAEVRNAVGIVVGRNQVVYPDAMDAFPADVRYTVTPASFEQDVILREQLPPPAEFGMNPATTQVEVWTEIMNGPEPQKRAVRNRGRALAVDEDLDFGEGSMSFGVSEAFSLGEEQEFQKLPTLGRSSLRASKQWTRVGNRTFLIEAVPYPALAELLKDLPPATADFSPNEDRLKAFASIRSSPSQRMLPYSLIAANTHRHSGNLLARIDRGEFPNRPGVVLDYILVSGASNFTFESGKTYYVSGNVYLTGTTTVEPGAVIKFAPLNLGAASPRLVVSGPFNCKTEPYWPTICTAKDDDSIGEKISGSTGSPSGYYALQSFLFWDYGNPVDLHDMRFRYAYAGAESQWRQSVTVRNSQFVNCYYPFAGSYSATIRLRNLLAHNCYYGIVGGTSTTLSGENLTFNTGTQLIWNYDGSGTFFLTNSLIAGVGNTSGFSGSHNAIVSSASGVFKQAAAGFSYLPSGSTHRGAGTTNINAALLTDLRKRTTSAPAVFAENILYPTTWQPIVDLDRDAVDLGYHYDVMDYAIQDIDVNALLTVTNGTIVSWFSGDGLNLRTGAGLISHGRPEKPNRFVHAHCVQEQPGSLFAHGGQGVGIYHGPSQIVDQLRLRFTHVSSLPGGVTHFRFRGVNQPIELTNARITGGGSMTMSILHKANVVFAITNSIFLATYFDADPMLLQRTLSGYNNLLIGSHFPLALNAGSTTILHDNFFWNTSLTRTNTSIVHSHNAYLGTTPLYGGSSNILLSSFTFAPSTFGDFYQVSSNLVNAGSRTSAQAGLYHFTTRTDQVKEGGTVVDIGVHYTSSGAGAVTVDTDGDGRPDYLEDSSGDGVFQSGGGETDWQTADTEVPGAAGLKVFTPLH